MTGRRLVMLNHAADAGSEADGTDYLVLDPAWGPAPGERSDVLSVRDPLQAVLAERNVHAESLAALDDWAGRADLVRRFDVGGTSWWYHARSFVRLDVQELILWHAILDRVAEPGRFDSIEVPDDRPLLLSALRAAASAKADAPDILVREALTGARQFGGGKPSRLGTSVRPRYRRLISKAVRAARRTLDLGARARARLLEERFARLVRERPDVLAILRSESFHVVSGADGEVRSDPIVAPVLGSLAARGWSTATVMLGNTQDQVDALPEDNGPMPLAALTNLLTDRRERLDDREELTRRLSGIELVRMPVSGVDLAPAVVELLGSLDVWFSRQRRERLVAERLMAVLKPRVLLTGWEAARTAWLGAARTRGVPSVAIQHGVIYRDNPDYYRPIRPGLLRPDLTCVFGAYERRLLVDECGYPAAGVLASGSPRTTPEAAEVPMDGARRAATRRSLGVSDDARMLVLSAARHAVGDELHSMPIFARLLGGELPGVHIVVKLHPEEERGDHYRSMIEGLASAGGYPAPPVTVVRDVDVFELLRAADAHLGIYSTVLTDAVVAGTPNMIAVGQAWSDLLGYATAGVARPVASFEDVRSFLQDPQPGSLEARRSFLRDHFEPGDGAQRIADAVVAIASRPRQRAGISRTPPAAGGPRP